MHEPPTKSTSDAGSGGKLARFWPMLVLLAGLGAFFALRLDRYVGFSTLKEHRQILLELVRDHAPAMAAGYAAGYALCVAFSLPVAAVMTIAAGFLFGQILGMFIVVAGATTGAVAVFLAARTAIGDSLRRRAGPWLAKMQAGFNEDALSYLLVLRLVPLFPFAVVNLVSAVMGMKLRDYALATFIGIIPGSVVYTAVGVGLGSVFDSGEEFSARGVLTPQVIMALGGLACLALLPVVYKRLKRRAS
ncbi:MAG: TVP38/TMEM64 family protein [Rhodospirillales bacterium]